MTPSCPSLASHPRVPLQAQRSVASLASEAHSVPAQGRGSTKMCRLDARGWGAIPSQIRPAQAIQQCQRRRILCTQSLLPHTNHSPYYVGSKTGCQRMSPALGMEAVPRTPLINPVPKCSWWPEGAGGEPRIGGRTSPEHRTSKTTWRAPCSGNWELGCRRRLPSPGLINKVDTCKSGGAYCL